MVIDFQRISGQMRFLLYCFIEFNESNLCNGGDVMIDKQGKLFGKINVIDLVVLLAVLLLVGGFLYREKGTANVAASKTVTLRVVCPYVYPDVAENLKVGDQLVASSALIDAHITKLDVKPAQTTVTMPDRSMILTTNPFRKDIFLEIEGQTLAVTPAEISLGGQKVRAGKEDYFVKTQKVELEATILKVDVK